MRVSVVIPTYNRRAVLESTLRAIFQQDFPANEYEVIVVVDGSTDGTAEYLRGLRPPVASRTVIQPNAGLAAARNAGLQRAAGALVLFLDDDIRATPGLLRAHVSAHDDSPEPVLAIGAVFLSHDSPRTLASDCFEAEIGAFYLAHRKNPTLPFPPRAWVFKNSSANRELLLRAGGFNADFRMQREDQDLGFRLGLPVCYVPDAIGYEFYDKPAAALIQEAREFGYGEARLLRHHPALWEESLGQRLAERQGWMKYATVAAFTLPSIVGTVLEATWKASGKLRHLPCFRRIGVRALQWHRVLVWQRAFRDANRAQTAVQ